jgi:hypothetical protein
MNHLDEWSVYRLGLPPGTTELLVQNDFNTLGEVARALEQRVLRSIEGIGPRKATRIEDAVTDIRARNAPASLVRFIIRSRHSLSNLLILVLLTLTLGLTCTGGPFASFNGDEHRTIALVACALLFFEVGRWAGNPQSHRDSRLTTGRIRILIVFTSTTAALLAFSDELDPHPWFGGLLTEEAWRVVFLGLVLGVWEGVKEFSYLKRVMSGSVFARLTPTDGAVKKRRSLAEWFQALPRGSQTAIIASGFPVVAVLITQFGETIRVWLN